MKAAIGFGSNLGNRRQHLIWARERIQERAKVLSVSRFHETEPEGIEVGPRKFLNAAAVVEFDGTPRELLAFLRDLEERLGRDPRDRSGPRALDLDILLLDGEAIREPDLVVPHPDLARRRFALEPLAEVAPDWVVPGEDRTVRELLEALSVAG